MLADCLLAVSFGLAVASMACSAIAATMVEAVSTDAGRVRWLALTFCMPSCPQDVRHAKDLVAVARGDHDDT